MVGTREKGGNPRWARIREGQDTEKGGHTKKKRKHNVREELSAQRRVDAHAEEEEEEEEHRAMGRNVYDSTTLLHTRILL